MERATGYESSQSECSLVITVWVLPAYAGSAAIAEIVPQGAHQADSKLVCNGVEVLELLFGRDIIIPLLCNRWIGRFSLLAGQLLGHFERGCCVEWLENSPLMC